MNWSDIESDPQYASLPDDKKSAAKVKFFDTVATAKPEYAALSDADKKSARDRFLSKPSASAVDPKTGDTSAPGEDSILYPFKHPIDFAKKQGLTLTGAGAGAAAAASAVAPIAALTGPAAPLVEGAAAVGGAAIGGGAGKMAQSGFESLGSAAMNWIDPKGPGAPIRTVSQVLAGGKAAAQSMAIGEAIGRPVGAAIGATAGLIGGKVVKPLALLAQKNLIPTDLSPEITEALKAANKMGILLTPGQMTQSTTLLKLETALRNLPFVAGVMANFDRAQAKQLSVARDSLTSSLPDAKTPYDIGVATKEVLERHISEVDVARKAATDAAQADFDKGTAATKQAKVEADSRLAEKLKAQRDALAPGGAGVSKLFPEQRAWTASRSLQDQKDVYLGARATIYEQARLAKGNPDAPLVHTALTEEGEKIQGEFAPGGLRGPTYTAAGKYVTPPATEGVEGALASQFKENPEFLEMARKQGKLPPETEQEPPSMTVAQAVNESKMLGEKEQEARFKMGDRSTEALHYGRLKQALESDIDAHFQDNPEVKRLGALAKAFHADYAERFRNDAIAGMYGENPVKTFNTIMESKNFEAANALRKALGPTGREIMQRHVFDELFGGQDSIPDKKAIIAKFGEYGPAIRAILSPKQQTEFQQFAMGEFSEAVSSKPGVPARTFEAPKFLDDEYTSRVRALSKSDPQKLTQELVPAPSGSGSYPTGNVLLAKTAKKQLPASVFDMHSRLLVENILTGIGEGEGGLKGILGRFRGYDSDYLEVMVGKKNADEMGQLGSAALLLPVASDIGTKLVGQAVGAMYITGMVLRAPVVLGGPAAEVLIAAPLVTKAYLSHEGRQYLTTLLRMSPEDPRAGKIVSDFMLKFGAKAGANIGGSVGRTVMSTRRIPAPDKNMGILGGVKDSQP